MSYVVYESDGSIVGSFATEIDARTEACSLCEAHAAGDPELSGANDGANYYVCVRTKSFSRVQSGITLNFSQQYIEKSWMVTAVSAP